MPETCNNCRFKHDIEFIDTAGDPGLATMCRRYPPASCRDGQGGALVPVRPDGWCGEWLLAPLQKVRRKAS